jgi:hypothetical protein
MIEELRLMTPAVLTLRAACGRLSRSARLLIFEVKNWRSGRDSFKNQNSTLVNPFCYPNGIL